MNAQRNSKRWWASGIVLAVAGSLAVLLGQTGTSDAAHLLAKKKVFRNLAFKSNGNFLKYLAIDSKTGDMKLAPVVSQTESGAYWEIERAWDNYRGQRSYYIRSRSNSAFNGYFLNIDSESGQLRLTKSPHSFDHTVYWSIKYSGHEHGRGAYLIQNLGHSKGGFDMSFIGADEKTGEIKLTRKASDGVKWTMNHVQVPPSEFIRR